MTDDLIRLSASEAVALAAAARFEQASGLDRMLPIDPRPGTVPA